MSLSSHDDSLVLVKTGDILEDKKQHIKFGDLLINLVNNAGAIEFTTKLFYAMKSQNLTLQVDFVSSGEDVVTWKGDNDSWVLHTAKFTRNGAMKGKIAVTKEKPPCLEVYYGH